MIESLIDGRTTLSMLASWRLKGGAVEAFLLENLDRLDAGTVFGKGGARWLKHYTEIVEAARLPPKERFEKLKDIEKSIQEAKAAAARGDRSYTLMALWPAWFSKLAEEGVRSETELHCAICGLACERYRLKHGKWPASLDVLAKEKLIKEVPTDPFDGQPLRFKQSKNGVIIYSIGPQKSNKGESLDNLDMPNEPYRIEFRLWNPEQRRQPPRKDERMQNDDK